jgi:hypothetical protein
MTNENSATNAVPYNDTSQSGEPLVVVAVGGAVSGTGGPSAVASQSSTGALVTTGAVVGIGVG